ncbi:MAG: helix-turn-helix domain-containing protein [Candidatus Thorarchaeota archaeon]
MTTHDPLDGIFMREFETPSDFLCCACGLRTTEVQTYFSLLDGKKSVEEIRKIVKRDRTTVQRVLSRLHEKGLVVREARTFPRGGYYYIYRAVSTEEVKQRILEQLDRWYQETRRFLLSRWPGATQ